MALVKHYKVLESQLSSLPIVEGQIIYTIDTKKIFLDVNNSTREEMSKDELITSSELESELLTRFGQFATLVDNDLKKRNKVVLSSTEPSDLLAGDICGVLED